MVGREPAARQIREIVRPRIGPVEQYGPEALRLMASTSRCTARWVMACSSIQSRTGLLSGPASPIRSGATRAGSAPRPRLATRRRGRHGARALVLQRRRGCEAHEEGRRGNGGAEGNRTPDLIIANDALSQLSYSPAPGGDMDNYSARGKGVARPILPAAGQTSPWATRLSAVARMASGPEIRGRPRSATAGVESRGLA